MALNWKDIKDIFCQFDAEFEKEHLVVVRNLFEFVSAFINSYTEKLRLAGLMDFGGLEIEAERFLKSSSPEAKNYACRFKGSAV